MTDLQLGLILIGALAVAGVVVYNRLQERSVRRQAERVFGGSSRTDVLLEEPPGRREPVLEPLQTHRAPVADEAIPDARVDYIVELELPRAVPAGVMLEDWPRLERRFGKRVLLAASDGQAWRRLTEGDAASYKALRAGLQLVSRAGVIGDAELVEFRAAVETLAGKIGAAISAPEMREALEAARELDRVCADADIQVALHVTGGSVTKEHLNPLEEQSFHVARKGDQVTLTLDVPRARDIGRSYEAMARAARQLASDTGGRLVDDQGRALDDRTLALIGAQLEPTRQLLMERGIEPGSPFALRLFS